MEEWRFKDAIRAAGMDPELVKLENAIPGKVIKLKVIETPPETPEPPVKEKEEFKWEESLKELTNLMNTGRPAAVKPPPKARKKWSWQAKMEAPEEPRQKKPLPPVDFSYTGIETFEAALSVSPRDTKEQPRRDKAGMFVTTSARFAHNQLTSFAGLDSFFEKRFADPSRIEWLDLSYNKICEIEPVLSMLTRLKTLYLHCNCLDDLDVVRKLRFVTTLRSLTLYGNPIEAIIDYRLKIVAALPALKRLDWGVVTPAEQRIAEKRFRIMMDEREAMEAEETRREELAAAERREKRLKAEEKRRRQLKEKAEAEKEGKEEEKREEPHEAVAFKETHMETEGGSMTSVGEEAAIIEEPSLTEEVSLEEEEPEEEEVIFPADLAESGPLDVKGKHKLHPDSLTSLPEELRSPSESSIFSTDTVCLEEIRQEFQDLRVLEANMDPEFY